MKTFLSQAPLKMRLLSGDKAKQRTWSWCFVSITVEIPPSRPWLSDHKRTVLSPPPEISSSPSSENSIVPINLEWPVKSRQRNSCDASICWRWAATQCSTKVLARRGGGWVGRTEAAALVLATLCTVKIIIGLTGRQYDRIFSPSYKEKYLPQLGERQMVGLSVWEIGRPVLLLSWPPSTCFRDSFA